MNLSLNSLEKLLKEWSKEWKGIKTADEEYDISKMFIKRAYSLGLSDALKAKPKKAKTIEDLYGDYGKFAKMLSSKEEFGKRMEIQFIQVCK